MQSDRKIQSDRRFSDAPFARANGDDIFDLRKHVLARVGRPAGVGGELEGDFACPGVFQRGRDVFFDPLFKRAGRRGELDVDPDVVAVKADFLDHVEGDDVLKQFGVLNGLESLDDLVACEGHVELSTAWSVAFIEYVGIIAANRRRRLRWRDRSCGRCRRQCANRD